MQMSVAVQEALAAGERQLSITLPSNMRFGIFGDPGKQTIGSPDAPPSVGAQQRAEFELAFLCAEMFRGQCTVVLESSQAAKAAEREFVSKGLRPRLISSLDKVAPTKAAGFGAKAAASAAGSEEMSKVVLLLRPTAAAVKKAKRPEGGVLVLLNPPKVPKGFEPVYHLQDNPHPDWLGGLLFHSFPGDWALAVSGRLGAPTVHGRSPTRPGLEQIEKGFYQIKADKNPFAQTVGAAAALSRRDGEEPWAEEEA